MKRFFLLFIALWGLLSGLLSLPAAAQEYLSAEELEKAKKYRSWEKALKHREKALKVVITGFEQRIPEKAQQLKQLQYLDLSKNRLETLEGIAAFEHLQHLNVHSNQLDTLPQSLTQCQRLDYLNAENNQIRYWPKALCHFRFLSELHLSHNKLKAVPAEISGLGYLKKLDLSYNQITTLPYTMAEMDHLDLIDLRGNPISEKEQERIARMFPYTAVQFQ